MLNSAKNEYEFGIKIPDSYGYVCKAQMLLYKANSQKPKKIELSYKSKDDNISLFTGTNCIREKGYYYYCAELIISDKGTLFIYYNKENRNAYISQKNEDSAKLIVVPEQGFQTPERFARCSRILQCFVDTAFFNEEWLKIQKGSTQEAIFMNRDSQVHWEPANDGEFYNNYFFGGNLLGIYEHLEEIKARGYDGIYLTPVWESSSNNRYASNDFLEISPIAGTWEHYRMMCEEAHRLGMLVIQDLAFNHVSTDSKYFKDSYNNPNSEYRDMIKWNTNTEYEYWYEFKDFAITNKNSEVFKKEMTECIKKYFMHGTDGIRLDLAMILPSNTLREIRRVVHEINSDAVIFGEGWNLATEEYGESQILGDQIDSPMNYPMLNALVKWIRFGDIKTLNMVFSKITEDYPQEVQKVLMNLSSSHDTATSMFLLLDSLISDLYKRCPNEEIWNIERGSEFEVIRNSSVVGFRTREFREKELMHDNLSKDKYYFGLKLLNILTTALTFFVGIPFDFATQIWGAKDPFNRKVYQGKEDMNYIKLIESLSIIRKKFIHILAGGECKLIQLDSSIYAYTREKENEKMLIYCNRSKNSIKINVPENYKIIQASDKNSTNEEIAGLSTVIFIKCC